jgi:hypothetical protein
MNNIEQLNIVDEIDDCLAQAKSLADCLMHASTKDSDIDNTTVNNIAFAISSHLHRIGELKKSTGVSQLWKKT